MMSIMRCIPVHAKTFMASAASFVSLSTSEASKPANIDLRDRELQTCMSVYEYKTQVSLAVSPDFHGRTDGCASNA
jgi:hypothetical protein